MIIRRISWLNTSIHPWEKQPSSPLSSRFNPIDALGKTPLQERRIPIC